MNKALYIVLLLLLTTPLRGQQVIAEFNFDGTDPFPIITTFTFSCDGSPGSFGTDAAQGRFIISDMEGLPCCPCAFGGGPPECGSNNNTAESPPIPGTELYCDITVEAVVSLSNGGANMECANNGSSDPTAVACNATADPGRDAMKIVARIDGVEYIVGGYCGNQQIGAFRLDNLPGGFMTIEITGGTQEVNEVYEIDRITISGTPSQQGPFFINSTNSTPCANDPDPTQSIVLAAAGGGATAAYNWELNGTALPNQTSPVLIVTAPVTFNDGGTYSVTITDPNNSCTDVFLNHIVNVQNCASPIPIFNLQLAYCYDTDQLSLPTASDDQPPITGTWNVRNDLILRDTAIFDSLIFTPDPSFNANPFRTAIRIDSFESMGIFPPQGVNLCVFDEPNQTIDLISLLSLNVPNIDQVSAFGINYFNDGNGNLNTELRNVDVSNVNANAYTIEFTSIFFGACKQDEKDVPFSLFKIDRGQDNTDERCEGSTDPIDLQDLLVVTNVPSGRFEDVNSTVINTPEAVDVSALPAGIYEYRYIVGGQGFCSSSPMDTARLMLTIHPSYTANPTIFSPPGLCAGIGLPPFMFPNGESYDENRRQDSVILRTANGCDSLVIVDLQYEETNQIDIPKLTCSGSGFDTMIQGQLFNESRPSDVIIVPSSTGCDSLKIVVDIVYIPVGERNISPVLCPGEVYTSSINNQTYDINNPMDTILKPSPTGCDSLIILELQYLQVQQRIETISLCPGETYTSPLNNVTYDDATPTDTIMVPAPNGCDSLIIIDLNYLVQGRRMVSPDLCRGETYTSPINGMTYNEQFTQDTLMILAPNGCDSIIIIDLIYNDLETRPDITHDGCSGDNFSVTIDGEVYDENNPIGVDTIPTSNGCDTIVRIDLRFKPNAETVFSYVGNSGDPFSVEVNGTTYDESNPTDTIALTAGNGCDSIITVDLIFVQGVFDSLSMTLCSGDLSTFQSGGSTYNEANPAGIDTFIRPGMPDSFFITRLTYLEPGRNTFSTTLTSGSGFDTSFNGILYDENNFSGRDTITNGSANGCDSIIVVNLSFVDAFLTMFDTTLCIGDGYTRSIGTSVYGEGNPSGIDTLITDIGIDSFVSTTLNFVGPTTLSIVESRCSGDGFEYVTWNVLFNEANPIGSDTLIGGNSIGCDSIIDVALTFNSDIILDNPVQLCQGETITVGNSTYDATMQSGTDTIRSGNGCDTIIMTTVTIDSILVDICTKPECNGTSNGSILIYNLDPGAPLTVTIDGVDYNLNDSLSINNLASSNYNIDIARSPSCMIVESAMVDQAPTQTLSIDVTEIGNDTLMLDVNFSGIIDAIQWTATTGSLCANCNTIFVSSQTTNTYTLNVTDDAGCPYTAVLEVGEPTTVSPGEKAFYISNAITAGGDPDNAVLFLQTNEPDIESYELRVFSRWGSILFDEQNLVPNDPSGGWNVLLSDNQIESAVYVYKVVLHLADGSTQVDAGDVLYIR